jgi:D-glycero-alpha-D-manno-heptose-7-phosphate kinase
MCVRWLPCTELIDPELVKPLQDYLMLFDTYQYRKSYNIIAHQLENIKDNKDILNEMVRMVDEGYSLIKTADYIGFGELLGASWQLKRRLSNDISTLAIDEIYETAIKNGAIGGKLLGQGGGGFMVFFTEKDKQEQVRRALKDCDYVPFQFETRGSEVIFNDSI